MKRTGAVIIALLLGGIGYYFSQNTNQDTPPISGDGVKQTTSEQSGGETVPAVQPDDAKTKANDQPQSAQAEAQTVETPQTAPTPDPAPQAETTPVLETLRVDQEGGVVLAGRAQDQAVDVLVDEQVIDTLQTDADGNFVALFDLPAANEARVLTLRTGQGDDAKFSEQEIIIAPTQIIAAEEPIAEKVQNDPSDSEIQDQQNNRNSETVVVSQNDQDAVDQVSDPVDTEPAATLRVSTSDPEQGGDVAEVAETVVADAMPEVSTTQETISQPVTDLAQQATETVTEVKEAVKTDPVVGQVETILETASEASVGNTLSDESIQADAASSQGSTDQDMGGIEDAVETTQSSTNKDSTQLEAKEEPKAETAPETQPEVAQNPEPKAPTVFAASEQGIEVLQSAEDLPADQIVLDAISYDDTGGVMLSGRGMAGATLQSYLNNTPAKTSQIDANGYWTMDMSDVAAGIYTLRLDQLDANGRVTARFETPFKREDRQALAQAAQEVLRQKQAAEKAAEKTAEQPAQATDDTAAAQPVPAISAITVQPGNTLWGISRARYGRGILYVRVFDANRDKIRDPDLIYPGQVFVLPQDAEQ